MDSEEDAVGREPIAVVLVSRRQGREFVDAEHKVRKNVKRARTAGRVERRRV